MKNKIIIQERESVTSTFSFTFNKIIIKGGIFMSNRCDGCPLKDDPNACKTMCARDHKRENDRERE
mgnify:FL=1